MSKLGEFIKQVGERNKNGLYDVVLGVSIDKKFMPSVANLVGTDLTKYNVVRRGRFAFNPMHVGRDEHLPIARYMNDEPALVSPAYMMFEATGQSVIPEYLELVFNAPYFDHLCWFHSDASVRGGLTWDDFSNVEINIPSLEKQKTIVRCFAEIQKRKELLYEINDSLFSRIKYTIEKYIFGKIKLEDLNKIDEILLPESWEVKPLFEVSDCQSGYAFYKDGYTESGIQIVDLGNITTRSEYIESKEDKHVDFNKYSAPKFNKFRLKKNDLIMVMTDRKSTMDLLGKAALIDNDKNLLLNQRVYRIRSKGLSPVFLHAYLNSDVVHYYHASHALGTAQKYVNNGDIDEIPIIIPDEKTMNEITKICEPLVDLLLANKQEIECQTSFFDLMKQTIE